MIRHSLGDNYILAYWHEQHMVGVYPKRDEQLSRMDSTELIQRLVELSFARKTCFDHESAQEVLFGFGSPFVTLFCSLNCSCGDTWP